ncbi:MAG: beta-galactosidase [Clostridiales bacterium]|nr:beta-galactosidase [Clostridiales bacterium]
MKIRFGADYYPEHWPRERWETDAKLMEEMGLDVIRMAEFSWSKMEPSLGNYNFGWLDEAIEILARHGMKTVLGTPTATPPAWIIEQSPEILPVDSKGRTRGFGGRHHDCQSNPVYRAHIHRFVTAMAQHYKDNPNVIGWQIDNELGNSHNDLCHCSSCRSHFQEWLANKYGSIDNLNARWGTAFWSQTYDKFEQIPTPMITPNSHNPSLLLDWKRFHSDLIVEFQQFQIDIIRDICKDQFITHNLMGFFGLIDYFDLGKNLDFVSHDQYATGYFDNPQPGKSPQRLGAELDFVRGVKQQTFWIMEQQSGPTGWEILGRTPRPGQLALWAAQTVAHGADTVVFFRWRPCSFGTEEYWHGILHHSGVPGRRYDELKNMISQLAPLMDEFKGALPESEVAILYSYEQNWAFEIQPHHPKLNYTHQVQKYYKALYDAQIPVDFINHKEDLSKYKLVIAPLQFLMTRKMEDKFKDYVKQGGRLVLTMRTGVKNMDNVCMTDGHLPGGLGDLLGIEIKDYDCLRAMDMGVEFEGKAYRSEKWCDIVSPTTARTIASYTEDFYAGTPAITVGKAGKGEAYYVGTEPDDNLMREFIKLLTRISGISSLGKAPEGVELVRRRTSTFDYIFALNHTEEIQELEPAADWQQVLGEKELAPYGIAVFKVKR